MATDVPPEIVGSP